MFQEEWEVDTLIPSSYHLFGEDVDVLLSRT